ncbi:10861_t:CDS:2, partial [Dentiscutata erythropus]
YEDGNKNLQRPHLEGWHDVNIWALIVDHGLRNIEDLEIVRLPGFPLIEQALLVWVNRALEANITISG